MKIRAWMQMGVERRETVIEIPDEEVRSARPPGGWLEAWLEEYVLDWMQSQLGWGWSGGGWDNDFACMEGSEGTGFVAVAESAIPNTRIIRMGTEWPRTES